MCTRITSWWRRLLGKESLVHSRMHLKLVGLVKLVAKIPRVYSQAICNLTKGWLLWINHNKSSTGTRANLPNAVKIDAINSLVNLPGYDLYIMFHHFLFKLCSILSLRGAFNISKTAQQWRDFFSLFSLPRHMINSTFSRLLCTTIQSSKAPFIIFTVTLPGNQLFAMRNTSRQYIDANSIWMLSSWNYFGNENGLTVYEWMSERRVQYTDFCEETADQFMNCLCANLQHVYHQTFILKWAKFGIYNKINVTF